MPEEVVKTIKNGAVASVIINRPEVMNAINPEIDMLMVNTFKQLSSDEDVRVIILEGAGDHFSVGADMAFLNNGLDVVQWYDGLKNWTGKMIICIASSPQPVICKVRGNAYGAGMGLALAGDFVVASENSRFCEAFANVGVTHDAGLSYFLPRMVGMAKAKEISLLGNVINGKDAASMGLIYRAVPEESLDAEVASLSQSLARKSLRALSSLKEALDSSLSRDLAAALDWEAAHQAIMLQSKEHKEFVQQFLKSRKK